MEEKIKKSDVYNIRSSNPEMYLQKVKNSTLFSFDGKRCYENNNESKPWSFWVGNSISQNNRKVFRYIDLLKTLSWYKILFL